LGQFEGLVKDGWNRRDVSAVANKRLFEVGLEARDGSGNRIQNVFASARNYLRHGDGNVAVIIGIRTTDGQNDLTSLGRGCGCGSFGDSGSLLGLLGGGDTRGNGRHRGHRTGNRPYNGGRGGGIDPERSPDNIRSSGCPFSALGLPDRVRRFGRHFGGRD
jgi:hypothetical protein